MQILLTRAGPDDYGIIWRMQVRSFADILSKYGDNGKDPALERPETVEKKLMQSYTYYYIISYGGNSVGAIRIIDRKNGERKMISPLFVLPEYRRKGIASEAIRLCESMHGADGWELNTIKQEKGNCSLYEKAGYKKLNVERIINDRMTMVYYAK
jgi:predicted N-acetyltransferase YhbS